MRRVLAFALAASLATSVVFGLLPALHLSRQDLNDALKEGGRQKAAAVGRGARELLIVAEVALSIVLLVGAGLLIRSLWHLQNVDPGFAAGQVLTMEVSLPAARYKEGEQMPFYQQLEERVRGIAGVAAVGADQHPAAQQQLRQPRHADRRSSDAGRAGAVAAGAIGDARLLPRDGHSVHRGPRLRRARRRRRPAGRDRQRGDGAQATGPPAAERDRRDRQAHHFNSGVPRDRQQVVGGAGRASSSASSATSSTWRSTKTTVPMMYTPHTQQPSYHTMRLVVRADADAGRADRPGARRS